MQPYEVAWISPPCRQRKFACNLLEINVHCRVSQCTTAWHCSPAAHWGRCAFLPSIISFIADKSTNGWEIQGLQETCRIISQPAKATSHQSNRSPLTTKPRCSWSTFRQPQLKVFAGAMFGMSGPAQCPSSATRGTAPYNGKRMLRERFFLTFRRLPMTEGRRNIRKRVLGTLSCHFPRWLYRTLEHRETANR